MKLTYVSARELERLRTSDAARTERCAAFADACRLNTLSMIMEAGSGHIGSSFSAMDIVAWLHLEEMDSRAAAAPRDLYFSSKGHDAPGLYSVLVGLGVLDHSLLRKLRRLGGLPGHPDIGTPYAFTNTGSLGMGISKAKGLVRDARLANEPRRVFVLTGDGELQEGQIWESLQGAANQRMHEICVIVDRNRMQSDTWVDKVSALGELEAKFAAFGWFVGRCDGHDLGAIAGAMRALTEVRERPKVLIADTVKGKGVKAMENSALGEDELYRFHSGAPGIDAYRNGVDELVSRLRSRLGREPALEVVDAPDRAPPPGERLVGAYGRALVSVGEKRPDVVVLDADLMLDCGLIPFRDAFPERFIECGIAEQDMVSQAGALALRGRLPLVHSFACFLSTRPNEQIYNNATEQTKIVYVGSLAGLLPAGPGHSHQSVRDISALAAIPGLTMIEPCCEEEVGLALEYCVDHAPGSCYLRLVSIPCDVPYRLPAGYRLQRGRGVSLRPGRSVVAVGYGPVLLAQAWHAADLLASRHGIELGIVNLPWLNDVDDGWLLATISGHSHFFTLDNHYVHGGQGQMLLARLASLKLDRLPRCERLGVRSIPACGQNAEVLREHGLDAESIAASVAAAMGR